MAVLVILDANPDEPEDWRFLKADEYDGTGHWDDNRTFPLLLPPMRGFKSMHASAGAR